MIPPENYLFIYDHLMLVLIFLTLMSYARGSIKAFNRGAYFFVPIFIILYIGTRPLSAVFVDMITYAQSFEIAAKGGGVFYNDQLFKSLMEGLSLVTSVESFFFICALIYILPIVAALKHRHGDSAFIALLCTVTSFSFFTYGVNGIRNGMATSILFAAIAWSDRKLVFALLVIAACGMHNSVAVPALLYTLTFFNANLVLYFGLWVTALIYTAISGGAMATYISSFLSNADDNRVGYLTSQGEDKGGFRIDFILYSIVPVIISYGWANPNKTSDPFYRRLLCAYLATNAFWLLVMYAAYSNRFAYLSWFLLPWVIIYPFLPNESSASSTHRIKYELNKIAALLVGQFGLTYLFDIIIYPNR